MIVECYILVDKPLLGFFSETKTEPTFASICMTIDVCVCVCVCVYAYQLSFPMVMDSSQHRLMSAQSCFPQLEGKRGAEIPDKYPTWERSLPCHLPKMILA